jgi:hypothetical protein
LYDFSFVKDVYERTSHSPEFVSLLYDFFEKHGKDHELIEQAAKDEVSTGT